MQKENPKYRTIDSPKYEEPVIDWPESLTDPSQNVPIQRLIDDHISRGAISPPMQYGVDVSRMDFTEAHANLQTLEALQRKEKLDADAAAKLAAEQRDAKKKEVLGRFNEAVRANSPELAKIAAELTAILPGFEGLAPSPPGGADKKS